MFPKVHPVFEALCTDSVVESGPNIGQGTDMPLQVIYACDYTEEQEIRGALIKWVDWYQCPDLWRSHPDTARQDIVERHNSQGASIGRTRQYPCTDLWHADPDTNGQALCPSHLDSSQKPGKEDEIDMEFGGSDTAESVYCTPFFFLVNWLSPTGTRSNNRMEHKDTLTDVSSPTWNCQILGTWDWAQHSFSRIQKGVWK